MLNELKYDMKGITLIGEYVGIKYLLKYPFEGLIFNSVVSHNDSNISMNNNNAFNLFAKYNLMTAPIEKIGDNIKSLDDFLNIINKVYENISEGKMSYEEEGSVNIN